MVTRRAFVAGATAVSVSLVTSGCRGTDETEGPVSTSIGPSTAIEFPEPVEGRMAVEAALRGRRSVRDFSTQELTETEIGQLLWAVQGVTADWGGRTVPSAGALYPLEVYVVTSTRTLRYQSDGHRAVVVSNGDLRPGLHAAALGQSPVGTAPAVFAITVVPERTARKYGARASRYVDLEVGHAGQNLLLQAVALGLVAVPIGAFDDDEVAELLVLPGGHGPRYLVPVGRPRPDTSDAG